MATAEELLAPNQCDDNLEVDLETRQIIIPDTVQNLGVESDDSVRILHFRVPRYYCEVDLSTFVIRINYKNTSGTGGSRDIFNPIVESDTILFDWVVARQVTVKKGDVLFNVCFREIVDDEVEREFNTAVATLPVLEGLETADEIIEEYTDLIEQWRRDLFGIGDSVEQTIINKGEEIVNNVDNAVRTYMDERTEEFRGPKGDPGTTPHIGINGNWWIGDTDTGFHAGGGGGGGGGGGIYGNNAIISIQNTSGWIYKSVSKGASCPISFVWSSLENEISTGPGVLKITVNDVIKRQGSIEQGEHTLDIGEYLNSGSNTVKITVSDIYGNSMPIIVTVNCVSLSLTSSFDASVPYSGAIDFTYVPTGSATKTVHFKMDNTEFNPVTVTTSGRQQTFAIPSQAHGVHIFECWFTADIDGNSVPSNTLRYAIICLEEGKTAPVIATDFSLSTVEQYDTIVIPYIVYDPTSLTADITLSDGSKTTDLTVDRTLQTWSYRPDNAGSLTLSIACGTYITQIGLTVTPTSIDVEAETNNLSLYLTAYGRSNNEANPGEWKHGNVEAELTGFNWTSDGWQLDEEGATVLRVGGDARVNIPVQMFAKDFRTTGKTIEVKFATRDILDYDAPVITCYSGNRGLWITAQKATLKSEQSEISTQYKEGEDVHLTFVVEKKNEHRLLMIYINGILSGVVQYPEDDDFSQSEPVGISIGSNDCTTDIYCVRVYENDLTRYQVVDNWIAEKQLLSDRAEACRHNDVFDDYGAIVIDNLPADLPYLVLEGDALPEIKDVKLPIAGRYVDPSNDAKSFTFTDATIEVQGTSSAGYERKNYKINFNGGFIQNGLPTDGYILGKSNPPANVYTFKADVASSEGANNVELVKLYNDISPHRTPPQQTNALVRQGIDGYPCIIFFDDGSGGAPAFIGKYNFNHDKASDVFGFDSNDESWETRNNTSNRALWKNPDFSGSDWENDFEARYPKKNKNVVNLAALAAWIASTDRTAVDTEEEKAARLAKFKNEIEDWFDLDSCLFYYLFTELFLLADSRTKNSFPTRYDNGKWCWLPYDMDTAIGINNEGKLAFGYELEDTDLINGAQVYTGQQSVMWNNIRDAFPEELMAMYQDLRSTGGLSYEDTEKRFTDHQAKWPEVIFNEDSYYKYLAPLFEKNNGSYLGMLQGSKAEQRKWWLYNRFRYIDSKYNAGDALKDFITLRGYERGNITVTPYADIYASVKYGSYLVQERALRGDSYVLECPVDDLDDTEIYIYSASQIAELGDLSVLKVGYAEFAAGTKLKSLKLGSASEGYINANLTQLYAGNNVLLRTLDVRNCPNLGNVAADVSATSTVDLSGCTNIERIYFDNTAVTGVTLPNGGIIKILHLPATITNLTIRNHSAITEFVMPSYTNITTLRLENVSDAVPMWDIFNALPANSRVRLIGFDRSFDSATDILALYDRLDTMRGLYENGDNADKAQVSGIIRVENITGAELAEMQSRYPNIKVVYQHITSYLRFYNGSTLLYTVSVADGGDGTYGGSTPTKAADAHYTYAFAGWSKSDDGTVDNDALKNVTADRNVYACFTSTIRTYTVKWMNGSVLLETDTNVPYGTVPTYNGSTPVYNGGGDPEDYEFDGWEPAVGAITGDTTYTVKWKDNSYAYIKFINRSIAGEYTNNIPTSIGTYAFYECKALTTVNFPAATSIGAYAFSGCTDLTTVNFPAATSIGSNAFESCSNLVTADFPVATSIGESTFSNCYNLTTVNFPVATSIGNSAFYYCSSLTTMDLPAATSIGSGAFSTCYRLTSLILRSETMATLMDINAFTNTPIKSGTGYIYVPSALVDSYKTATNWKTYANQFRAIEDYPEITGGV